MVQSVFDVYVGMRGGDQCVPHHHNCHSAPLQLCPRNADEQGQCGALGCHDLVHDFIYVQAPLAPAGNEAILRKIEISMTGQKNILASSR